MAGDDQDRLVRAVAAEVLARVSAPASASFRAPVGVSGRHVHLSPGDVENLFGRGEVLSFLRPLKQPGQFAAQEVLTVIGPSSVIPGVRVVGPARGRSNAELSAGDFARLGYAGRVSAGQPFDVTLAGPAGVIRLEAAGVISRRHLHATLQDAAAYRLGDGDTVSVKLGVDGRGVVFNDVLVRVDPSYALEFHLDRDEANACGAETGDDAEVIVYGGPSARRTTGSTRRRLLTEADVLAARNVGTVPDVRGALLTPCARDAMRAFFPEVPLG